MNEAATPPETPPIPPNAGACVDEFPPITQKAAEDTTPPNTKVAEDVMVSMDTPVDIEVTSVSNPALNKKFQAPRNMWAMLKKILDNVDQPAMDTADLQMVISTVGKNKDGSQQNVKMAQGPIKHVLQSISAQMIPSQATAQILFSGVRDLLEPTPIRGVLVTAIFENQQPMAFAMLNHTLGDQLTDDDINMLAHHAQVNVDMFREKMRKNGHQFPDDNPIIMPGRGKLIIPR